MLVLGTKVFLKSEFEIEPQDPLFGGWKVLLSLAMVYLCKTFYLSQLMVVLPEGSKDPSAVIPVPTKYSYLDNIGMRVLVLEKKNVVPKHNSPFQVYLLLQVQPSIYACGTIDVGISFFLVFHSQHSLHTYRPFFEQVKKSLLVVSVVNYCDSAHI